MKEIAWVKAALKDFGDFPPTVQDRVKDVLAIAACGQKADSVKPLKGLGGGVYEIVASFRTDAFRVVYAVQIGDVIWVVHAFQKKSTKGIATPQKEIDLVRSRIKRLREILP